MTQGALPPRSPYGVHGKRNQQTLRHAIPSVAIGCY